MLSVSQAVAGWTPDRLAKLTPATICIFSNYTLNSIEPFVKNACYEGGFNPTLTFGLYGAALQELRSPDAPIHGQKPDVILYSEWLSELVPFWQSDSEWDPVSVWESRILPTLTAFLELKHPAQILVTNFVGPFYSLAGETGVPASANKITRLNSLLDEYCVSHGSRFAVLDLRGLVGRIGEERAIDYRFLSRFKAPWTGEVLQHMAGHLFRRIASTSGRVKKCLVLDCDHTLWGGVVGEEGLAGIYLSSTDYPGVAYYEFQKQVLALKARGVVLALCSKNNEADVLEVLDNHPDCLLKRDSFVAWRINWKNKAENIRELAVELNLGLDSFVFVDDNAYECGLVHDVLPSVAILQAPGDVARLPRLLADSGLFEYAAVTVEDGARTAMYQAESARKQDLSKHVSLDEYLASLDLHVDIGFLREADVRRVAQLTQKTNQFNLTTHRYTDAEVDALRRDQHVRVYTLRCRDKFGDMGLTNLLVVRYLPAERAIDVDTFLMSCRVFERRLEYGLLAEGLKHAASQWDADWVKATYVKTPKNELVSRFWDECGFTVVSQSESCREYRIKPGAWKPVDLSHLKIKLGE